MHLQNTLFAWSHCALLTYLPVSPQNAFLPNISKDLKFVIHHFPAALTETYSLQVVYTDDESNKPEDAVEEIFVRNSDINRGFGGK